MNSEGDDTDDYNKEEEFLLFKCIKFITSHPETLHMQIQDSRMAKDSSGGGFITKNPDDHFILYLNSPNSLKMRPFATIATTPIVNESTDGNYGTWTGAPKGLNV